MPRLVRLVILPLLLLALAPNLALAQKEDNIFNQGGLGAPTGKEKMTAEASLAPVKAPRGGKLTLKVVMDPAEGYHAYPFKQPNDPHSSYVAALTIETKKGDPIPPVTLTGEVKARDPDKFEPDPDKPAILVGEIDSRFESEHALLVRPDAAPGVHDFTVKLFVSVCDSRGCTPFDKRWTFKVEVTDEPPVNGAAPSAGAPAPTNGGPVDKPAEQKKKVIGGKPIPTAGIDPNLLQGIYPGIIQRLVANVLAPSDSDGSQGLGAFILAGIFWGFISLVTPCVFPMIPITVSFFLKQSEKEHHRPVMMATVYCLTIVGVLTLSALFLLKTMQVLSQHPAMNFFLGGLFIFFALSLFGWYEIELPKSLTRYTSAREGQGGYAGTVFMALTFTIISFACVAPFLGTYAGTQTRARPVAEMALGALAFSVTFAAPFFFLALFPGLLRKMPKSGSWLNAVKVVMGFVEMAAALGFLRAGELTLLQGSATVFFTYDLVIASWVILSALCGLYLLGLFRTPHDSPLEHVSVPRLLWAVAFLGLAVYLTPALWKHENGERQRPAGVVFAWIDAFLLEEPGLGGQGEQWSGNLQQALQDAAEHVRKTRQRRLIFIDFTGIICKNCRLNEREVFPNPRVKDLLKRFELVQLVTDSNDAEGEANKWLSDRGFNTLELPLYVILEPLPSGEIKRWGQVGGKINSIDSFVQFLERPFNGPNGGAVAKK
jgi:thiol:disulfide interchange protein